MDVDLDSEDIQIVKYPTAASKIYRDLWLEFYSWEHVFCRQNLEGLSKSGVHVHPRSLPHDGTSIYELPAFSSSEEDFFTFEDISFDSTTEFAFSPNPKIIQTRNLEPSAAYTACTAISTNTIYKDDPAILSFAPYADDPLFDLDDYLSHAGWFTWQSDFKDPDLEMIQLEAVRRLRHGSGFKDAEIDSLKIFPLLRESSRSGLIWYSSQRDFLWWPGSQISDLSPITTDFVNRSLQIHENVLKDAKLFCPNLNCIQTHCSIHKPPEVDTNEIFLPKALVTNGAMMSNLGNKCGDFCYKDEKYHLTRKKNWSDQERSEVESIFKLMPDTTPCDMAIICRKPCFEIYIYRKHETIYSDEKILENRPAPRKKSAKKKLSNENIDAFVWTLTCHHLGPCNKHTDCNCFKALQRCQRTCGCSKDCEKQSQHLCQNNKLQKAQFPAILIHKSNYGFGAFAAQKIAKNSYIGEYVALIYDSTNDQSEGNQGQMLSPLQKFTGLNYSFELTPNSVLDALSVGNEMRYINDSRTLPDDSDDSDGKESIPQPVAISPNCEASIWLVNDVHRIAITATKLIKLGDELYLDYGDNYWKV